MQKEFLTDEDIYGTLDKNETPINLLKSKIDKLKEELEEYKDVIKTLKEKIERDIKVNERCILEEHLQQNTYEILKLWIKYDKELLEIINEK